MNAVVVEVTESEQMDAAIAELARIAELDKVGAALEGKKDEAVQARSGVERRWYNNLLMYNSQNGYLPWAKDNNIATGGAASAPEYLASNDNVIKPKVITIAARISDMLFPTNDRNWGLTPSPMPSLPEAQDQAEADLVNQIKDVAQQRCERMQKYIDDQLAECKYAASGRQAIFDGCLYGTGVLKGPLVKSVRRRVWKAEPGVTPIVPIPQVEYVNKPASKRVDPWNFYPQPCRRIEEAEYVFELNVLTKTQVSALAKEPGFDASQVARLAEEKPNLGALAKAYMLPRANAVAGQASDIIKDRYAVWEYHGPIPRECLCAMGVDLPDALAVFQGEVWFSQGIVLKAVLNHMECAERLPYYVWNYEEDPNDVFGLGVVDQAMEDQIAVNQSWHAIMLNSMMSSGPQIGVNNGVILPVNGKRDISCVRPKVWLLDGIEDITKALSAFTVPNVTPALLEVYERAKQNCRDRTLLPYFEKEPPAQLGNTLGGLAMVINADNIVTRRAATSWDDNVTIPKIGAYNDWNMLYNPDPECKGDFEPIATGASQLLVKDMTTQHVMALAQMTAAPPMAEDFDHYKVSEMVADQFAKVTGLPVRDALLTPEQKAQQSKDQPPDPKIVAAQIDAQSRLQVAQLDGQVKLQVSENDLLKAEMQAAADERISIADVQAKFSTEANREATKQLQAQLKSADFQFKVGTDTRMKAEEIAQKEKSEQRQVALEDPVRLQ